MAAPTERERIKALECQVDRVVSDIDSEKGTRRRIHMEFSTRIDALAARVARHDRIIWMGAGIIALLNLVGIAVGIVAAVRR